MNIVILLPVITLLIERVLELFDVIFVSNFFSWWRSSPVPPPAMILHMPSKKPKKPDTGKESASGPQIQTREAQWILANCPRLRDANGDCEKEISQGKVIYNIGANQVELRIDTVEEAVTYCDQEKKLHYQRLVYYIKKHGCYLLENRVITNDPRVFPWWPLLKFEWWQLERHLACREGVLDLPVGTADLRRILSKVRNFNTDPTPPKNEDLVHIELLADYCYLRNQRTREAFGLLKRNVYALLGVAFGIFIANLLRLDTYIFSQGFPVDVTPSDITGGFVSLVRTSTALLAQILPAPPWVFNLGTGILTGVASQPIHGLVSYVSRRPRQWQRRFDVIQSSNIQASEL